MSNKTTIRFNANYMRPVILAAYESGNKKLIKNADVREKLGNETFFDWYIAKVVKLYDACLSVARLQHDFSNELDETKLSESRNAAFAAWKELLGEVEPTTTSKVIRCNPADVNDLVGFCWKFVKDANNVSGSKDFVAKQVYGDNSKNDFRKKVEIMLGNMAAETTQMDSYKVRYLREESKLLGKIRKNKTKKDEIEKVLTALRGDLAASTSDEKKAYINTLITNNENVLNTLSTNVTKFTEALAAFHADPSKYLDKEDLMTGEKKPQAEKTETPAATETAQAAS